ncbi:TonB-dependent receptor [Coralloluteibacterium stylophorae]|uniref:TonB-dependent receptor n=1 Tax=Coralloluteibacterium stylophorae TaxID=1776034 RepID=A0A8J7VUY9_9GAMM|nr:TonB-dependent receptor [Coralloluteibacterium stylophorae]MBS7456525.1 TonB-dependent receptor [Coralloluteibacterium stylophorae]
MPSVHRPLALAIGLALALPIHAQTATRSDTRHDQAQHLDAITVTASPLRNDTESLAQPVEVLSGEELDRRKAATLGETVSLLPGVQSTYFGTGVGRPIIRGQEGPRVQVLSNGTSAMDVSTVSQDHAVSIEPFLADQIEVLKGPATLIYGSGAIGGAVNVVDGRVPLAPATEAFSGRAEVRGNTVNDETTGMFRVDGGSERFTWHADAFYRDGDDFDIPGVAQVEHDDHDHDDHDHEEEEHEEHEEQVEGTLANSSFLTKGGAVGGTFFGERGYIGAAVSTYQTNYGIPEGAHLHVEEDGHDHDHDHEDEEEEEHEEHVVRIDLDQTRYQVKAGLYDPLPFLEELTFNGAYNDYEHVELESGEVGTRFENTGYDTRIEALQKEVDGWRGAFGVQISRSDFEAIGEEAFVPPTVTDTLGAFVIQEKDFGPLKLEGGLRHDRVELEPGTGADRSFDTNSISASALWRVSDALHLTLGADRSERAPTQEELYANGAHIATASWEVGDAGMDVERARRLELGMHVHTDPADFKFALYQTDFDDFVYLADTGIEEFGLPVRLWAQTDAKFRGAEAEAIFHLADNTSGLWDLRVFGDYVHATFDGEPTQTREFSVPHDDHTHDYSVVLDQTGDLPRIAPSRIGADLGWGMGGWRASVGGVRYGEQDRVADNEEPSEAYTLVNAHLSYHWDMPALSYEVFLDGTNLTDREARQHTSLLRDYAPLPGRGVAFGVRAFF